jgi:heavy metal translocating P-type ATPase
MVDSQNSLTSVAHNKADTAGIEEQGPELGPGKGGASLVGSQSERQGTTGRTGAEYANARYAWVLRLWHAVKRYPLPLAVLALLFVSLALWLAGRTDLANWVLFATALLGGIPLLWETVQQFLRREFSVDLIAILAITGSLLLGQYLAGAFVVLMLSGGEALEAYALRRARSSLSALAERAPRTAHIWQDEQLIDVPAETIEVGMAVVVKPGELIPVDGAVIKGSSSVSEADLTGEPMPVRKSPGMVVLSGSVNLDGVLQVRASKRSLESKYAQIVRLVREAQEQKAPIHRLADRYSVGFTAAAVALAALAWALSGDSVYALAVLVVATPCPLILATPIAIMSGVDLAARNGIIVKSGAAIEQLGEVDVAVFDKTGTLTLGIPKVSTIVQEHDLMADGPCYDEDTLLRLAASVEQLSTHILARAIVEAAQERELPLSPAGNFEEEFGKGVQGNVCLAASDKWSLDAGTREGQVAVAVGKRTFMNQLEITIPSALLAARDRCVALGQIGSFIAVDGQVAGLIVLQDMPREELSQLAPELKQAGIKEIVLLTGDTEVVAQQIGRMANFDRVVARCLPEDKVQTVRELLKREHRVLMVGDGVNDAPALATATVGMALGSQGLTAAATAADAVLLSTDIQRVVTAVRLGRHVMRVALQGIWIGMGLSVLAMLFASFGFISPPIGAILQEGIDVIVILNALRAGRIMRAPVVSTQ